MAFDLEVVCGDSIPSDLREQWPTELLKHGIECEIHPGFSAGDRPVGFLPFKVVAMPHELIDADLESPAMSGFEVGFKSKTATFRSASGRTCTEFALLCLCAAELAIITNGVYQDRYSGKSYTSDTVLEKAITEIKKTLQHPRAAIRVQHAFKKWL